MNISVSTSQSPKLSTDFILLRQFHRLIISSAYFARSGSSSISKFDVSLLGVPASDSEVVPGSVSEECVDRPMCAMAFAGTVTYTLSIWFVAKTTINQKLW